MTLFQSIVKCCGPFLKQQKCPKALCFQGFSGTCKPSGVLPIHDILYTMIREFARASAKNGTGLLAGEKSR
jgi:hypothetical protein